MSNEEWVEGKVWTFSDERQTEVVKNYKEGLKNGKKRLLELQSETCLEAKRIRLRADFIQFCGHCDYRIRKGKHGMKDRYYELICCNDDETRAPKCSFGAKFEWQQDGSAKLKKVCMNHSCAEPSRQIRNKEFSLLYTALPEIRPVVRECRTQADINNCKARIENASTHHVTLSDSVLRKR